LFISAIAVKLSMFWLHQWEKYLFVQVWVCIICKFLQSGGSKLEIFQAV